jgi:hypothetical protein
MGNRKLLFYEKIKISIESKIKIKIVLRNLKKEKIISEYATNIISSNIK